jgi:hypothetical protein
MPPSDHLTYLISGEDISLQRRGTGFAIGAARQIASAVYIARPPQRRPSQRTSRSWVRQTSS